MSDSAVNKNQTKKQNIMKDLGEYNSRKSLSTPTELLVEFLSSIMVKDYEMALKYCIEILRHEPNNTTALEFYPLIVEKLEMIKSEELESTSSETSLSSSSMSSTSSENVFFHNKFLNRSPYDWEGNYKSYNREKINHKKLLSVDKIDDAITSNPIVSKTESANEYATTVESNIALVPKSNSNFGSLPKQELSMKITGNITPLPSNLLIHPTQTITLIGKNASNVPTRINPRSKKEKQTTTTIKKKPSELLLHTTPTMTFPKRLPPRNLARTENLQ